MNFFDEVGLIWQLETQFLIAFAKLGVVDFVAALMPFAAVGVVGFALGVIKGSRSK